MLGWIDYTDIREDIINEEDVGKDKEVKKQAYLLYAIAETIYANNLKSMFFQLFHTRKGKIFDEDWTETDETNYNEVLKEGIKLELEYNEQNIKE